MKDFDQEINEGLHALVDDEPTSEPPTGLLLMRGRRMRRSRMAVLVGAMAGVLLVWAAVLGALPASSPAWAVEPGPGNTVTVRINEYKDANGLETRLRAEGIRAVVDYIPNGTKCINSVRDASSVSVLPLQWLATRDGRVVFTIDRDEIAADQTLSILVSVDSENTQMAINIALVSDTAEHCTQQ